MDSSSLTRYRVSKAASKIGLPEELPVTYFAQGDMAIADVVPEFLKVHVLDG
jgi:hypothetical protein